MRWLRFSLALVFVLTAGCGVPTNSSPRAVPDAEVPDVLDAVSETIEPTSPTEVSQEPVAIWFARDDQLVAAVHRITGPPTVESVVAELLGGPSDAERERGMRTAIADPEAVGEIVVERGVASVELTARFAELPASDQVVAIAQIVLTTTDLRGVGRVRFTLEGEEVAVPLPDGTTTTDAVSRDDYLSLTASG